MRATILFLLLAGLVAADPETELRAAHTARTALEAEERSWADERERLQAGLDALAAQAAEDRAATAVAAKRSAGIRSDAAGRQATAAVRTRLDPLLNQVATALAALRATAFPGTVPAIAEDVSAADALEAAERADAQVAASIERVRLDGQEVAVRVLRAGLRQGWWMRLDGSAAGTVAVVDGVLDCQRLPDPGPVRTLFAQFDGREAPRWIPVPAP